MSVLVLGIPSEPPVRLVIDALRRFGEQVHIWNQRHILETEIELRLPPHRAGEPPGVVGWLRAPGLEVDLGELAGIYVRFTENGVLPELQRSAAGSDERRYADEMLDRVLSLCAAATATVVNRPGSLDENASKPRQLQLLSTVFHTPATLVTNSAEAVGDFLAAHHRVVYKSTSGERSIVQELAAAELGRAAALRRCPVQFQELVEGVDVRVHALTSGATFGSAASSDAVDYRYCANSELSVVDVPPEIAQACVHVTAMLDLEFAGFDFKVDRDGRWVCLEANPSPAFSAYEEATGQPISSALAAHLSTRAVRPGTGGRMP